MSDTGRIDRIRDKAYGKWESEGRLDGDHERHWHEASREIEESEGPELPHDAGEAPGIVDEAEEGVSSERAANDDVAQGRTAG